MVSAKKRMTSISSVNEDHLNTDSFTSAADPFFATLSSAESTDFNTFFPLPMPESGFEQERFEGGLRDLEVLNPATSEVSNEGSYASSFPLARHSWTGPMSGQCLQPEDMWLELHECSLSCSDPQLPVSIFNSLGRCGRAR